MSKSSVSINKLLDVKEISPNLLTKFKSLDFVRKPSNFSEIGSDRVVELTKEEISCLEIFHHETDQTPDEDGHLYLLADYKIEEIPQYHILIHNKTQKAYLVDTQGFQYPRYMLHIKTI